MAEGAAEEALEQVWTALRDHYPALEYLGAFDDAWLAEFRPRVRAAAGMDEAWPIIEELVIRLRDVHTRLHWPGKPEWTRPDVRLGWVEGGVAVLVAGPDTGLRPGTRVSVVDGVDAVEAVRRAWPRSRGANPEGRAQAACDRLVHGPAGSTLVLSTEDGDVALVRPDTAPRPRVALEARRLQDGDAAVLRIPAWHGDDFVRRLDALLEELRDLPHLVIDVRGNGGGNDAFARACVGRFIAKSQVSSIAFTRIPGTDTYTKEVAVCHPRGPWRYGGRVAVLADSGCCSACVHFVASMRATGAGCVVGTPTDGGCGFIRRIDLRGGATLFCSRSFPIDGGPRGWPSPLHGVPPHIHVPPALEDLRAGRDGPLRAALGWLRSDRPVPPAFDATGVHLPS